MDYGLLPWGVFSLSHFSRTPKYLHIYISTLPHSAYKILYFVLQSITWLQSGMAVMYVFA